MYRETSTYQFLINRLAFVLLVLVPLAMYPDGSRFNVALSKFILLTIVSVVFLGLILWKRQYAIRLDLTENRWLLAYVILLVVSTIFALSPKLAILGSEARKDGLITFVYYLVAYSLGRQLRIKEPFLLAVLGSIFLVDLFALIQFFKLDPPFLQLYAPSWRGLSFSTMGNPNFLGSYLTLAIPFTLYFYLQRSKWYGLVMYGLTYFSLLATRTRGSWIGAMFGFVVMVWLYYRLAENKALAWRRIIVLVVLSILLFGVFVLATDGTILQKILAMFTDIQLILTDPEDADTAGTNRFYVWRLTVELIKDRPLFGVGVENMSIAMNKAFRERIIEDWGKYRNWDKAHNEYLNIALASGIPSLIAYLGFVWVAMKKGYGKIKTCPMMLPLLAAASGYLVQAFFNIQMVMVYYFFMAVLGMMSSQVLCVDEGEEIGRDGYSHHDGDDLRWNEDLSSESLK